MNSGKVAVLDIGSNTIKLFIAYRNSEKKIIPCFERSISCRISSGLIKHNDFFLSSESIAKIIHSISLFIPIIEEQEAKKLIAVGTEALRKAKNANLIVEEIKRRYGFRLRVLSGEEEAECIAIGISTDPRLQKVSSFHAFDLGGGSVELIQIAKEKVLSAKSLSIGAVVMTEKFFSDQRYPIKPAEVIKARNYITCMLQDNIEKSKCEKLIACGGTVIHLRHLLRPVIQSGNEAKDEIIFNEIQLLLNEFISHKLEKIKNKYPEIPDDRIDIFPAALLVIDQIMKFYNSQSIIHSFHNLRYGIATKPSFMRNSIHSFK